MAWLLSIPLPWRCLAIFLVGLPLGSLLNLGIYTLAWNWRPLSPWTPRTKETPPRRWFDRIPVLGWLTMRRESARWGRGFWIRPILIELATGAGLATLYYWEVTGQLLPQPLAVLLDAPTTQAMLHQRFFSHGLLILLMIVATFIDFDEKTIPDWITVPGTILGLAIAALWPASLLTDLVVVPVVWTASLEPLWLTSPLPWEPSLDEWPGMAFGLFCFLGWCFGILEKRWTLRRGWRKAFQFFFASIFRYHNWLIVLAIALVGCPLIVGCWLIGGDAWRALLSALAGVAFGGGLVWAIRIIGSHSLGREAMGFGDVTLMAMIGAFVGWQGALIAFFIAPFAALFIALAQWLFTGKGALAFGPYLCAGALFVLLRWAEIWEPPGGVRTHFSLGWFIPLIVVFCLGLMWLMLIGMRWLRERGE